MEGTAEKVDIITATTCLHKLEIVIHTVVAHTSFSINILSFTDSNHNATSFHARERCN